MDQPKIPTLKDSQKPQVKVRGLGGGLTLMDRMKQFKKKDLAFILAGLGTLFMAPLAEHFMMSPDNGDASSSGTFGPGGGGPGGAGSGNGIFGVDRGGSGDGTAPGGPAGGGSDVITPLNVRDPSALIMGPGSAQQPPVGGSAPTVAPVTAPSGHNDNDVRDALAASAVHAAGAALGKTPLPMPKIGLSNNTLRGLGVVSGGSSATAGTPGLAAPGAANFGHAGGGTNMAPIRGGGNIAAVTRGPSSPTGGLDALKAAAGKAFDRSDLAAPATNGGASSPVFSGGGVNSGGNGAGSTGANDKAGAGDTAKQSKQDGTSLAYELMKQNLQKQLELYWKEKEAMDPTLELYKLRNTMAESIAGSFSGAVGGWLGNTVGAALSGTTPGQYICKNSTVNNNQYTPISTGAICQIGQNCASQTTSTPGTTGGSGSSGAACSWNNNGATLSACPAVGFQGTFTIASDCYLVGSAPPSSSGTGGAQPAVTQMGGGGDQGAAETGINGPAPSN